MARASSASLLLLLSAAALAGLASAAAAPFLSDGVFQTGARSTGRSLLQVQKDCPMSFEFQDYKIITNQCKGPKFPAKECCTALKQFACPFVQYLNDDSNNCATTMFSYINLYGKYPPGLFANECKEGKQGLSCEGFVQRDVNATANGGLGAQSRSFVLATVICGLTALLFH